MAEYHQMHDNAAVSTLAPTPAPPPQPQPLLSRTCQNCATAKIKCMRRGDSITCERCNRLNKPCTYRPAKRRNNGTRKDMRIEALEAKFNQLLEARQTTTPSGSVSPQPPKLSQPATSPPTQSTFEPEPQRPRARNATIGSESAKNAEPSAYSSYGPRQDVIDSGLLTLEQAESLLEIFKSTMLPHFPFVVIAAHTTASELRYWKPFLFLSVLAASSFQNVKLQKDLDEEFKQTVSSRMILIGEISFDLLQGLLVHLAWFTHAQPRQYSQYLHLAISIIVDLRLDQPPRSRSYKIAMKFEPENVEENTLTRTSWGHDEQRAVAGCSYLSASTSMILQKMSTFPHSTYIENCCKDLENKQQYPSDRYLRYIVQLQHIVEKVDKLFAQFGSVLSNPDVAVELHILTLKSELEIFQERLPFQMKESYLLTMKFHTAELYLYQIALQSNPEHPGTPSNLHLKILCAGLRAAKSFLNFYISLPLRAELAFNNSEWVQVGFALIVGARLSVAVPEDPIYHEAQNLRRSLDMSSILKQTVLRTRSLRIAALDTSLGRDVFFRYEERARGIQTWFEKRFSNISDGSMENVVIGSRDSVSQNPGPTPSNVDTSDVLLDLPPIDSNYPLDGLYDLPLMDYLPDSTMEGVMGDWTSYPMVQF